MDLRTGLPLLCFCTAFGFEFDKTILVMGNSWLYEHRIELGPAVPSLVFDGTSYLEIGDIENKSDTTFFLVKSVDEDGLTDSAYEYQVTYGLSYEEIFEISVQGDRPEILKSIPPWFISGSELQGTYSYVNYGDKKRVLNDWSFSPGATYGTTRTGSYLQGVGMIAHTIEVFGPLRRDRERLNLIRFNEIEFDASGMELIGAVGVRPKNRVKGRVGEKRSVSDMVQNKYFINGRKVLRLF